MASYSAQGLVLKKTRLGEADLIITMLSTEGKQLRAVAKGARKSGSTTAARLELGHVVDVLLHQGKNLDIVIEVRLVESNPGCSLDIEHMTACAVVLELAEKSTRDFNLEPLVYKMSTEAIRCIGLSSDAAPALIAAAAVLKVCAALGFGPVFDTDAVLPAGDRQWVEQLLRLRFCEIQLLDDARYQTVALHMLACAKEWLSVHLDIRLRSVEILQGLLGPQ
ncbi:MAG: DNA repair protein RecO [Coriobacteriales bacterium]|jgi:DNA repair protein RecO (recombination protein O)|nr:DNA repair protein RecO [Coriobacteriales bacterium]